MKSYQVRHLFCINNYFDIIEIVTTDFPESPSALKKSLMYDMPLEYTQADLSDNENDKSVYEAHLSSNLQNVSLTMNEKEGKFSFL